MNLSNDFDQIERRIDRTMLVDRHRLAQKLRGIRRDAADGKPVQERLQRLAGEVERSVARCDAREAAAPKVTFDGSLPIHERRDEIAQAIRDHQVVVVSGETGSGKSTQLPKICLDLGRGRAGFIGHTQPRRIAARSIAARVAEELESTAGSAVGFKIRFTDSTSPSTYVKLMTDGILLAETQGDRYLNQYDTIILDEAHERSLNVDFLIGYLKRLLPQRPELKLIITSATIDSARFARHFAKVATVGKGDRHDLCETPKGPRGGKSSQPPFPAPVIEVSGRTWPVDVRWRPIEPDEEGNEPDLEDAVLAAVKELARVDSGDMLVFMPTERDIHDVAKTLRGAKIPGDYPGHETEILPLYARLPAAQQQRVFQPHPHRRIVIATNVAESSLTVPGIRYVIDPGTARISRYSARSRTQRLPVEAVSQASADQRAGRCGRLGPGICIRLYSQQDYEGRDRYTVPEILRSNLASVILQTKALRLGDLERFPLLDPPKPTAIRDGFRTLVEIGATDAAGNLTDVGRTLSRLPVDPRIGRMILAGDAENCLREVLIIASALEVRDPRERPIEKAEAADAAHAQWADAESDFLSYLKLWDFYHDLRGRLSRNQLSKACRQNFLSFNRMREWLDIHRQLLALVEEAGMHQQPRRDDYAAIHRAVLTGLLSSIAQRGETNEYTVAGGGKGFVWPGSGLFSARPPWVVAAEVVETTRRYLRGCAKIDPRWIEPLAEHLVKRSHSDPRWQRKGGAAVASERVTLLGLTIVAERRVAYGPIHPEHARELFIQHGLVEGQIDLTAPFLKHNQALAEQMETLEAKLRRHDLLLGLQAQYDFYDRLLPPDVYDVARLNRWRREAERDNPRRLFMTEADFVAEAPEGSIAEAFPDALPVAKSELPLEYRFEPGSVSDGVTLCVPLEALGQVDSRRLGWLVPGLLEQRVTALIKSLPKPIRRLLVPAPDTARRVAGRLPFGQGDLLESLAAELGRVAGQAISPSDFQEDKLPVDLRMNVRVVDPEGKPLAEGRDLTTLGRDLHGQTAARLEELDDPRWRRDGITRWDFGPLPEEADVPAGGVTMKAYPALIDAGESVSLRLADSPQKAAEQTRAGLRRLFCLACQRELKTQVQWLPDLARMLLHGSSLGPPDLRQQLADLIATRALDANLGPAASTPRSEQEFTAFVKNGRKALGVATQDVANLAGRLFESYHQARLAAERTTAPSHQEAAEDVRRQLGRLLGPGALCTTPWEWLVHFPRYFRAAATRLEKLSGSLARDRQLYRQEIEPREEALAERAARHEAAGIHDPELTRFRWMLEEFRVSLFAQQLGTSQPVSPQRLNKQWERVAL